MSPMIECVNHIAKSQQPLDQFVKAIAVLAQAVRNDDDTNRFTIWQPALPEQPRTPCSIDRAFFVTQQRSSRDSSLYGPAFERVEEQLAHAGDVRIQVLESPVSHGNGRQYGDVHGPGAHEL